MKIVYKSKSFVVLDKPFGMPSQPDKTLSADAMSELSRELVSFGECGELYPVHRLDRVVGGLIIFARNKKSAALLSELLSGEGIGKKYFAVCDGAVCEKSHMTDYLYKDARQNIAVVCDKSKSGAKKAELICEPIATEKTEKGEKTLLKITLLTGRFHQIRAQLSSRGFSITGDKKYGSRDFGARDIALYSGHLSLWAGKEKIHISSHPPLENYPWNLFSEDKYNI